MPPILPYLKSFKKLHIDRSHGAAPHKPVLLIAVLQGYRRGDISDNKIYITPELVALFKSTWDTLVITDHDCRISYPFYYLKSEGFWRLIPKPGFDDLNKMGSLVKSFNNLNAAVAYAELNPALSALMKDDKSNTLLHHVLLETYFPGTGQNLIRMEGTQLNLFYKIEAKILEEDAEEYKAEIKELIRKHDEEEIFLRGSVFKREVPRIYHHTCCISGMRVDGVDNISMIDACHITPFSISYNDTITNGLALCPNLHRAFDRGLISIDESYRVMVSKNFTESTVSLYSIRQYSGKEITLPYHVSHYPSLKDLHNHRLRFGF